MFRKKLILNNKKGITLIALIITIIVLLILAGVALNFVIGENGILKHAEFAKEKYENKATEEENMLAQAEQYLANYRANEDTNNIYSVEEQVVGKWIDGKKLYRKVIVFENLTYDGNVFVGSLELQNLESYCRAEVYHLYDGPGFESYRAANSNYYLDWYINSDNVYINNKISNVKNYNYIVIVEYTKTTD